MKAFHTFDTNLRRNLLILFAAGLLFWSSTSMFLPVLPVYVKTLGNSEPEIGIIMGGFAIGLLLFRPTLGKLADKYSRKLVLLIGTAVAFLAPFGYLSFTSIPMLILVRIFHGISVAAFTTGYSALVSDLSPVVRRGEIISYMSLTAPIGFGMGLAMGEYLVDKVGYPGLFLFSSTLAFIGFLGTTKVINPPLQVYKQNSEKNHRFWQILLSQRVRVPALVMLLVGISVGSVHVFVSLFIKSTPVDFNAGLFFMISAIASFSFRVFTGKASDRFGRGLFITFGVAAYVLACVILSQANSTFAFILAAMAEGCGGGTVMSMITTLMADRSLPHERGRIFALCIAGFDFGIAIAAPMLGFVAGKVGYHNMYGYTAALTSLGLIIFLTLSSKNTLESLRFALGRGSDAYSLNNRE
ncbi:MFS transporter [Nostoc sp. CENA543]|uniref:MFS transporter n=1 Tax=Nostoc sp. CENA543 TaxID=1869241 RepID=UPI000CA3C42D|nr:MFS transporter [Nostoc sp. CENA543]AUT02333.1 MFS transporter [Nostoc sp. CENA543]